jgi:hypothetical protein
MATQRDKEEKLTAEAVTADKPPVAAKDADEPTFRVERLRREPRILGYSSHEVAGAFHGVADGREVTLSDAKQHVREWLKAPQAT